MTPSLRFALAFSVFPFLLALVACDSGTSTGPAGAGGIQLTLGTYFIQHDADDSYQYDQYFEVLPDHHWEFVEYGYVGLDHANLCQLTRQAGTYSATDTSLTVTELSYGESIDKCHMTKADFQAYPMTAIPERPTQVFRIRNPTAAGFEGEDLFIDNSGWKTYAKVADPYGFY
ncbi:MAG: hypothetical protein JWO30_1417 [Fibrobacteres bacterium]|nr:hypothetical protein [Fibrobacterota bacterium]